jgi:ABC-type antimicrobial peptide transport system permease subunit
VVALAVLGVAVGVPAALAAARLVESLLFGMKHNDPQAITAAVAAMLGAAALAGYLPARHASRIDPMLTLRHD